MRRHAIGLGLGALALCFGPVLPARAQAPQPSISDAADRPGFADSPVLLGRGQIQVESGMTWKRADSGASRVRTITLPEVELHAGLSSRVEVSIEWDGLVSSAANSGSNSDRRSAGSSDLRLGGKFGLVNLPAVNAALIIYANLLVGSPTVSPGYSDPVARFAWGISLSDRAGVSGTVDLGAARDDDGRVRAKPAASAALGTRVVRALNGYAGVVAESPGPGSTPNVWSIEGGVTLPLASRTQIDAWSSRRVAGGSRDWSIGAGFVRRLR